MIRPDLFHPAGPETLLKMILDGLPRGEVFGIARSLFFTPDPSDPFRSGRYGRLLETPLGVAAGPHSQMAQNIVSAWLCGARFIELKTVQALDELEVTKPCIEASDEGYNCEWSQELRLEESFGQYLSAMALIHVLRHALGHPENQPGQGPGFILNMSAGYDLKGVKSPPMTRFLDRMASCPEEVRELRGLLSPLYPALEGMSLPDFVSDNLTLSTMHGCPPDEIERIARHFLEDRRVHACVKLNPTLLGPEAVRSILNGRLGYAAEVPDEAFGHDLKYPQAVELIASLRECARKAGRHFGVKLTNTLEVVNRGNLPPGERMLYLSGRALHPLSVSLAARLRETFGPELDISFCAGVDALNVARVAGAGLTPVTLCTELLKPGGYGRLRQCVEALREAAPTDLAAYAAGTVDDPRYRKDAKPSPSVKTPRPLPMFDCAAAPCMDACAAGQDIPGYLSHAADGRFDLSLAVIRETNPFPHLLGRSCDRLCRTRCTRMDYDRPLRIREVKLQAARTGGASLPGTGRAGTALSASVKGAGVEGLACAYFLARAGVAVTAYGPAPGADGRLLAGESGVADLASILAMGVRLGDGDAPAGAIEAMTPASGPAGLPSAVRRGRRRAEAFLASSLDALAPAAAQGAPLPGLQELFAAKARRDYGPDRVDSADAARIESARCLRCGEVCNVCVTVCPNRANMAIPWKLAGRPGSIPVQRAVRTPDGVRVETSGREGASQLFQIVNVADFCNECGNCASFCPSAGAPHRDKFRLHLHRASFESAGQGAWFSEPGRMEASLGGERMAVRSCAEQSGSARAAVVVESPRFSAILDASTLEAVSVTLAPGVEEASLALAARAGLLYNPLSDVVAVFWK